ncbi:MAG TPA: hypothetical protein VGM73_03585 [Candidatus Didemnitutus sp.]|jgi:hypothetical protein
MIPRLIFRATIWRGLAALVGYRRPMLLVAGVMFAATAAMADDEDHGTVHVSKHVSDMILAPFRNLPPATKPEVKPVADAKSDDGAIPDPEVIKMAPFIISEDRGPVLQKPEATVKRLSGGLPGTGISEFKGRHVTFRVVRFLFIPFEIGLSW